MKPDGMDQTGIRFSSSCTSGAKRFEKSVKQGNSASAMRQDFQYQLQTIGVVLFDPPKDVTTRKGVIRHD